jgi:S-formylglutathione hydrolase FrmB
MSLSRDEAPDIPTASGAFFELDTVDIDGIPMRIYRNAPEAMRAVFESTHKFADREAMILQGERCTYGQQYNGMARFAHMLQPRFGVAKGDTVALASRNFPELVIWFLATQVLGAVAVALNAWWPSTSPVANHNIQQLADNDARPWIYSPGSGAPIDQGAIAGYGDTAQGTNVEFYSHYREVGGKDGHFDLGRGGGNDWPTWGRQLGALSGDLAAHIK